MALAVREAHVLFCVFEHCSAVFQWGCGSFEELGQSILEQLDVCVFRWRCTFGCFGDLILNVEHLEVEGKPVEGLSQLLFGGFEKLDSQVSLIKLLHILSLSHPEQEESAEVKDHLIDIRRAEQFELL